MKTRPAEKGDSLGDRLLAVDPSYRKTGICVYTGARFHFRKIQIREKFDKSFEDVFWISYWQAVQIQEMAENFKADRVVVEYPPPFRMWAGPMYMLVTQIIRNLMPLFPVLLSPPAVGRQIFHGKWKKTDSRDLARRYHADEKISEDQADAFVMLLPLLPKEIRRACGVQKSVIYKSLEDLDSGIEEKNCAGVVGGGGNPGNNAE